MLHVRVGIGFTAVGLAMVGTSALLSDSESKQLVVGIILIVVGQVPPAPAPRLPACLHACLRSPGAGERGGALHTLCQSGVMTWWHACSSRRQCRW
jgi:hypothetical protein